MERLTLEKFFSGKLLRIPSYQRDYAWEKQHVDELWSDLREAVELGAPHYIGTFILARTKTNGVYDLVDGQQRLTSLTMMLQTLIERLPETEPRLKIVYEDKYVQDASGKRRLTLLGDNDAFFRKLLARENPEPATRSQKRLAAAFSRLGELARENVPNVDGVMHWLEQVAGLQAMEFVEDNEGNAIRIFETVNDRGRPLATIEKVKSHLIYASSKYLGGALDAVLSKRFGRVFRAYDRIKDIGGSLLNIQRVTESRFNEDTVLRYHFLAYPWDLHDWGITADSILKDALKPTISAHASNGNTGGLSAFIDDYTEDLTLFFEAFAKLMDKVSNESRLYKLFTYLGLAATLYPLTIRLEMRNLLGAPIGADPHHTFLDILETTDVRVYKTRGTNPERDAAQIAAFARKGKPEEIASWLLAFVERFMPDDLFRQQLRGDVYRNNEGAQFILLEWDECERDAKKLSSATLEELKAFRASEPTIDHVLAQDPTFATGRGFRNEEHFAEQVHRLGNLTLIEKRINSAARNKTPEQKASDSRLYKQSWCASSRALGIQIDSAKANGTLFGVEQVDKRTSAIGDFCLRRWPLWRPG